MFSKSDTCATRPIICEACPSNYRLFNNGKRSTLSAGDNMVIHLLGVDVFFRAAIFGRLLAANENFRAYTHNKTLLCLARLLKSFTWLRGDNGTRWWRCEGDQSTYNVANNWGPLARKLCLENKYFSSIMDKCIGDCVWDL